MPNWCYTQMTITAPEEELNVLDKGFNEARKCSAIRNDFGEGWLGNILQHLGYPEKEILEGNIRCRGSITYYDYSPNKMIIDTETAWGPMFEPIILMCEKYAPNADIKYVSEESGVGMYITNDKKLARKYCVDCYSSELNEEIPELMFDEPVSKSELGPILEHLIGRYDLKMDELIRQAETVLDINIYQYEFEEIDEV